MQLSKVQAAFVETMLDHPDAVETPRSILTEQLDEGEIPLPERLKIYRNNIVGGLTDTLIVAFPVLDKLVGREFLEVLVRSYILENPPTQGCLNTYGRGLDLFIKKYPPADSLPYLADVATFETAMTDSYYAPNDQPLTAQGLSEIAPADLATTALKLRASAELVSSDYPLTAIRDFCLREATDDDEQLNLDQGGVSLLVYRPYIEVLIVESQPDEFLMLQNLKNGIELGRAVEKTLQHYGDFDFQGFLQKHLELETFQALSPNT